MKKVSLSILTLAAVGMLSTPAMAYYTGYSDTGFYVAGRAGYAATSAGQMFGRTKFGDDLGTFSLAAGVQNGGWRGEIEALTRTEFKNHDKKMDSYNLTFNFMYDIDLGYRIKPFVGGSAGFSHNKMEQHGFKTQKHTDFVWGPMAGLSYDITDNLSADFTYKYLIVDNYKTTQGERDLVSNEYTLGLRYRF